MSAFFTFITRNKANILFFIILPQLLLLSCTRPPLIQLDDDETPLLRDNGSFSNLITGLEHHQKYLNKLPPDRIFKLGDLQYSRKHLLESVEDLLSFLSSKEVSPASLAAHLRANYTFFKAGGRNKLFKPDMLITGYYEPLLKGSLIKNEKFSYPLYKIPKDLITRKIDGDVKTGRLDKSGNFFPYWSREEIEENLYLKNNELVYLSDPFDAFSLHVQGSGKIIFPDQSVKSIRYAGSNGRQYNSIGKLLVDKNIMSLEEISMEKIREYLTSNPDKAKEIYYHNERYIFFSWASNNNPPAGSSGVQLTPERSIAIDQKMLPAQALGFLITRTPIFNKKGELTGWAPYSRIVLPQDSGSAIKGAGRVDLFWGNGENAKASAGIMKEEGTLYFLVKKRAEH